MAENVLRLVGIHKTYGLGTPAAVEVLHGIDLRLDAGEFVALIGPSGSGKSTLLNLLGLLGLLDRPTSGQLFVQGLSTTNLDEARRTSLRGRTIGFVFQAHFLLTAFTAAENVMMPLLLQRGRADTAMREVAESLLERVGLGPWQDSPVGNLSSGQQQRVAIARALALAPPLVLADEPTGNLDTHSADAVFELMREINHTSGTTFLMVTHNLDRAGRCDRPIELVEGLVVPAAAPGRA